MKQKADTFYTNIYLVIGTLFFFSMIFLMVSGSHPDENIYGNWTINVEKSQMGSLIDSIKLDSNKTIIVKKDNTCSFPAFGNSEKTGYWTIARGKHNSSRLIITTSNTFFNGNFDIIRLDMFNLIIEDKLNKKKVTCFKL
jgi:hypothetical protein